MTFKMVLKIRTQTILKICVTMYNIWIWKTGKKAS